MRAMQHNTTSLSAAVTTALISQALDFNYPTGRTESLCAAHDRACIRPGFYTLHMVTEDPLQAHNRFWDRQEDAQRLHQALIDIRTSPQADPQQHMNVEHMFELRLTTSKGCW